MKFCVSPQYFSLAARKLRHTLNHHTTPTPGRFLYNEPDARTGVSIIASLARQLAVRNGTIHSKSADLYHKLTKDQPKVLLDVCAGLVTIERSTKTVRFIHATAHKFISELESEYLISADRNILKACVYYMSFEAFSRGPSTSDEDLHLRLREYPFLTYSAQFWGGHLANIEDMDLERTTLKLLDSVEVMMTINQVAHLSNFKFLGYSQLFPKQVTPLHLAVSFGLLSMFMLFGAAHQKDLDSPDSFRWTALHRAAENGHEKIVKFLMEKDCDVNLATTFGGTALHRAAKNGHTRIAALLLGYRKILVDVQDNYGGTALHRAARDGHKMVAQLLLDNGANVNRKYSLIAALNMLKKNGFIDANATSRGY